MSLTPLQLDAGAGLLQNQGLAINAGLTQSVSAYKNTALLAPFINTLSTGAGNILSTPVLDNLQTLAANTCSALSNSVPPAYSALGQQLTIVVEAQAAKDICGANVSKLTQAVNQAQGYTSQATDIITSAVNSQTYLGNTFTTMDSMITGCVSNITTDIAKFGYDLKRLGRLIDLANLDNLGSPLALVRQLYTFTGTIPTLSVAFVTAGVSQDIVLSLNNPTTSVTDSAQKIMYRAMTQIQGNDLAQILQVLAVTTVGIETMADLLNPFKLFPNSYQTLTVPTASGLQAVYNGTSGSVNTNLITELPPYVTSSLV